ncbi:MAG: hypothetical protein WDN67_01465 [Candidatus Moraniibacteriota bacterium]
MRFFRRKAKDWEATLGELDKGVSFFGNSFVRTLMIGNALFLLASLGILLWVIRPREASIVLHYNIYFGVDLLGAWWHAYLLPGVATLLFFGHLFLARSFYRRHERIASYLLLLAMLFLSFAIVLSSLSIAFINY